MNSNQRRKNARLPIAAMTKLDLKPGDALVVHVRANATADEIDLMGRALRRVLPSSIGIVAAPHGYEFSRLVRRDA